MSGRPISASSEPWRPIDDETPKGWPLLLFARAKDYTAPVIVVGWYLEDRGWVESSFSAPVGIVPSHWMPLPGFPGDRP